MSHSNNIIVALSVQAQASALIFNLSCTHEKPKPNHWVSSSNSYSPLASIKSKHYNSLSCASISLMPISSLFNIMLALIFESLKTSGVLLMCECRIKSS